MPNPGRLKLSLVDVYGAAIREDVDVELRNLTRGSAQHARVKAGRGATITDLLPPPDGLYNVSVLPSSYLPVAHFVGIQSTGTTALELTFPIDPRKVRAVKPPAYDGLPEDARRLLAASDRVLLFEERAGEALYAALDDIRRAGLLNILAKTRTTVFASGRSVLSYLTRLIELRGDRFFAVVPRELREETKNATLTGLFVEAPGLLHHPPEGFDHAGSYKTTDAYGNLQLTFFARGADWCADVDIDDAGGLAHAFQVLRNTLTGRPTHPYDIHQILVRHQRLDPGYALVV